MAKEDVDMSKYVHFIRRQGGPGCWGYSLVALLEIMNEMACPFSPNLSMRQWLEIFRERPYGVKGDGLYSPDGRFHEIDLLGPEWGEKPFFKSFGFPTEGTEPTLPYYPSKWPQTGWSLEGINEALNYRMGGQPKKLDQISSEEFIKWLDMFHPIQIIISAPSWGHLVTVVGYDSKAQTFKYVSSSGDKWGKDGFETFTFQQLDKHQPVLQDGVVVEARVIDKDDFIPPKPVPAARISFKHSDDRSNVHLWLSVEDSPLPRRKIWSPPQDNKEMWDECSCNLSFTVRLPSEFIWPPSYENRLMLDLYDAANFSNTGGCIEEFTAVFGLNIFGCGQLMDGPIIFKPREHLRLFIP